MTKNRKIKFVHRLVKDTFDRMHPLTEDEISETVKKNFKNCEKWWFISGFSSGLLFASLILFLIEIFKRLF